MEQTIIKHPRLRVQARRGSEGPFHDPYAFEEICVHMPNHDVTLHEGLGTWLKVDGVTIKNIGNLPHDQFADELRNTTFPALTGWTIEQLRRIAARIASRCRACGGRSFREERGHPGEYLNICDCCGTIRDSYFNRDEVM